MPCPTCDHPSFDHYETGCKRITCACKTSYKTISGQVLTDADKSRRKRLNRILASIVGAAIMTLANYLLFAAGIIAPYSLSAFAVTFALGATFLVFIYFTSERTIIRLEVRLEDIEKNLGIKSNKV